MSDHYSAANAFAQGRYARCQIFMNDIQPGNYFRYPEVIPIPLCEKWIPHGARCQSIPAEGIVQYFLQQSVTAAPLADKFITACEREAPSLGHTHRFQRQFQIEFGSETSAARNDYVFISEEQISNFLCGIACDISGCIVYVLPDLCKEISASRYMFVRGDWIVQFSQGDREPYFLEHL